jgi:hypothetical protein
MELPAQNRYPQQFGYVPDVSSCRVGLELQHGLEMARHRRRQRPISEPTFHTSARAIPLA